MVTLKLRPGLAFCVVDGNAIFLDLDSDRYFRIEKQATRVLVHALAGSSTSEQATALRAAGLLIAVEGPCCDTTSHPTKPVGDVSDGVLGRVPAAWLMSAIILLIAARVKQVFRPRSLMHQGLRMPWLRVRRLASTNEHVMMLTSAVDSARSLLPLDFNCVSRSHALRRLLLCAGIETQFVVGVSLHPFIAHCWLQRGEHIVGDHFEFIDGFTPLAVLPL